MEHSATPLESLRRLAKYLRVPKGSPFADVESAMIVLWESDLVTTCDNTGTATNLDLSSTAKLISLVNACFGVNLSVDVKLLTNFTVQNCCREVVKEWSGISKDRYEEIENDQVLDRGENVLQNLRDSNSDDVPLEEGNLSSRSARTWNDEQQTQVSVNRKSPGSLHSSHGFIAGDDSNSADQSNYNLEASHQIPSHHGEEHSESGSFSVMDLQRGLPMAGQSEEESVASQSYDNRPHNNGMGLAKEAMTKPFTHTMPSLFDAAMSVSTAPSMEDKSQWTEDKSYWDETTREGPDGERDGVCEDEKITSDPMSSTSLALHPAVRTPSPVDFPDARIGVAQEIIVMDLEMINEESSGNDLTSTASPRSNSKSIGQHSNLKQPQDNQGTHTNGAHGQPVANTMTHKQTQNLRQRSMQPNPNQHHSNEFYNYRHQYYKEQYHYIDDQFTHPSEHNDGTESTCSSVTLSQAFQPSTRGADESCNSSFTDDSYAETRGASSYISNVSSVTLSHALSVERHEHEDQGFYVATRLGDFVAAPKSPSDGETVDKEDEDDVREKIVKEECNKEKAEQRDVSKHENEEQFDDEKEEQCDAGTYLTANVTNENEDSSNGSLYDGAVKVGGNNSSVELSVELESISHTSVSSVAGSIPANENDPSTQFIKNETPESDILPMLVHDCGVPAVADAVPTIVATATQKSMGMLLPWHSTRSIEVYRHGGRGGRRKKTGTAGNRSIFSHSSIHTFRG